MGPKTETSHLHTAALGDKPEPSSRGQQMELLAKQNDPLGKQLRTLYLFTALAAALLLTGGKEGKTYLINRDRMGQFNSGFDDVVQELPGLIGGAGAYDSPAFFDAGTPNNRWIDYAGQGDSLRTFQLFDYGLLSMSSILQSSHVFRSAHGAEPSISANGTINVIVWVIDPVAAGAVLYAHDATNLANELYNSSTEKSLLIAKDL